MKKALKNLPQPAPEKAGSRNPFEIRFRQPKAEYSKEWSSDLTVLREFLATPTLDDLTMAVSLAFQRIQGLSSGMLTVVDHSSFTESDWARVMMTIDLDASIMRHGFEMLFEAFVEAEKTRA